MVLGALVLVLILLKVTFFAVDETEFVIVTQFGRPVRTIAEPGLHAKLPYQTNMTLDKRLMVYNPRPSEFLTKDKKNLVIDNYVSWRIQDPNKFVQSVWDTTGAEMRLHDIVWAALSASLGNVDLSALVSTEPEKLRTDALMDDVTAQCNRWAQQQYGIEIVDVRIKRLNLPEQNKQSVFARMRAERERIARQYRAEGDGEALRIRAEADREREQILSEAYREAERIKGDGDAQSTRVYADAYKRDPEFYKLTRTLEAYKKVLDEKTAVILSSDSELFKLLTQGRKAMSNHK
jgi:membrane protease subunit HflC